MDGVDARALLEEHANELAREGSEFWMVKPQLSLTKTANLETLVTGQYISVKPGQGKRKREFTIRDKPPAVLQQSSGLNLVLVSPRLGSVKAGVPVYYREMVVGSVLGTELAETADHVRIFINIEARYAPLVTEKSKFWNASGINVHFGLFAGAKINTESLESIIGGGIAFATPDNANMGAAAIDGKEFRLYKERKDAWLEWRPVISLGVATDAIQ